MTPILHHSISHMGSRLCLAFIPIPLPIIPLPEIRLFLALPRKMLTTYIRGKSTTCVESCGKRWVKAVSKWEKPVHFPTSCPPMVGKPRLFPPLFASHPHLA